MGPLCNCPALGYKKFGQTTVAGGRTPHTRTDRENNELLSRALRHNNTTPFTRGHSVLRSSGPNHVNPRVRRIPDNQHLVRSEPLQQKNHSGTAPVAAPVKVS
jgi:hypothetical protein